MTVASLLRLYLVLRLFHHFSEWTSPRAERVCSLNAAHADSFFAIKVLLEEKPYIILSISLTLSTFILGFAIRVFENATDESAFNYTWNSFWLIILTMTTST